MNKVDMPNVPEFPGNDTWVYSDHPLRFDGDLRGRVVVLDFWTYCCINCLHTLPDLASLERKYTDDPIVFIGVHSNKYPNEAHPANVREAIRRLEITHPVVIDQDHTIRLLSASMPGPRWSSSIPQDGLSESCPARDTGMI